MWLRDGELMKSQEIGQEKQETLRGSNLKDIKINSQGHDKETDRNF